MPCESTLLSGKTSAPLYALILLLTCPAAQSTERNGTAYPLGLDTVLAGRMPPPGFTTFFYASAYDAKEFKGSDGRQPSAIDDFHLSYESLAVCLNYVYPQYTLLGATVGSRVAQPFIKGQFSYTAVTAQGRVHYSGKDSGLGDLAFTPLFLGWSSGRLHQRAGLDFYAPTGSYDEDRLFNSGTNVWSYSPWYSFTANPVDELEISAKILYMINGKNTATDYRSGDEFNADYHLGYSLGKNWQVGMSGYLYKQVSDDRNHGEAVNGDGNRGQVLAYGPMVKYQTPEFGVLLKWQHETQVKNRASGERVWMQAVLRF